MWKAADNSRSIDLSLYNRRTDGTYPSIADIKANNPGLATAVYRAVGGDTGVDPSFAVYYDTGQDAEVCPEAYVVVNVARDINTFFGLCQAALKDRPVGVVWFDCERNDVNDAVRVTDYIKTCLRRGQQTWGIPVGVYSAAWWWDSRVIHGWEPEWPLWAAHYVWTWQRQEDGIWQQSYTFEQMDACLPIDNSFTPRTPAGWKGVVQPVKWQFSEHGQLSGIWNGTRYRVDMDYDRRDWLQAVHNVPVVPSLPERVGGLENWAYGLGYNPPWRG